MPNLDPILQSVLKKIVPSAEEKQNMQSVIDKVTKTAKEIIKPHNLGYVLAGSFTRDTWLSHKKEFDLFILFPENVERERLEKLGLEVGRKITAQLKGKHVIAYAEHPYTRAKIEGYDVDIVPCYNVKSAEQIKSAVDRTPFHNKYIEKKMSSGLSDDVRLLKQLTKAHGLYGSDLKTQGFSGYLCELLIIKNCSFANLITDAAKWVPGQVFIDLEGKYKGSRSEFKGQPVIVIDPVDPKRNVAAALSPEKLVKFIEVANALYCRPSENMFFKKQAKTSIQSFKSVRQRGTKLLFIKFKRPGIVDDILYPQLRKTSKRLADILREYEFAVMGEASWADEKECGILIELEVWSLPNIRKVIGPPVFVPKHGEEFTKKYKSGRLFVEDDRWIAEVSRKFKQADAKLKDSLSEPASILKAKGIATYIADILPKGFTILEGNKIFSLLKKEGFGEFLLDYFEKNIKL